MQFYFAPMEGVTGWRFRSVHHRYFKGVDRYYMPFLSPTQNRVLTPRMRRDVEPRHNEGLCAVPQLLTKNAEDFLWTARALSQMGYEEVNLNLGCPSGTVVSKGKGAGFLADLPALERFLDTIFAAAPMRISVKTRLGLTDPAEFGPILELYNRYPIAELTIHARVRQDMYRGAPRMAWFDRALACSRNPVCYNGDLVNTAAIAAFETSHPQARAVMIGRGLVANPALLCQYRTGAGAARETLRAFVGELYQGYCEDFGSRHNAMLRMKEVWFYLIHLFEGHEAHLKRLRKAQEPAQYEQAAAAIFAELVLREHVTARL